MSHSTATLDLQSKAQADRTSATMSHLMPLDADARLFASLVGVGAETDEAEVMNTRFAGRGKDATWLPIRVTDETFDIVAGTLDIVRNLAGFTVHDPYQRAIIKHLGRVSPRSRIAGAADVARRHADGHWEGDIAAVDAFRRAIRMEGIDPKGARVWLMGVDGTATAAALALANSGISSLTVAAAEVTPAIELATRVREAFPGVSTSVGVPDVRSIDIVVNGLPAGAEDGIPMPFDPSRLRSGTLVIDALSQHRTSPFADCCAKAGLPVVASDCILVHLTNIYEEFFSLGRIPYKDATLHMPCRVAA